MIKGALILAIGLSVGYVKGMQENTVFLDKLDNLATRLGAWAEAQNEKEDKTTEGQDGGPQLVETDDEPEGETAS